MRWMDGNVLHIGVSNEEALEVLRPSSKYLSIASD